MRRLDAAGNPCYNNQKPKAYVGAFCVKQGKQEKRGDLLIHEIQSCAMP